MVRLHCSCVPVAGYDSSACIYFPLAYAGPMIVEFILNNDNRYVISISESNERQRFDLNLLEQLFTAQLLIETNSFANTFRPFVISFFESAGG